MTNLTFVLKLWRLLMLVILLGVSGCGKTYYTFAYQPQDIAEAVPSELHIAIMPFKENRKVVDEGNAELANIPLVPTAGEVKDAPQSETVREQAEYYFPDLIAYAVKQDFEHNKVGSVVHLAPAVTDHYDLVVTGSLDALPVSKRKFSYGVSYLAEPLSSFGPPSGRNAVEVKATYRISSPRGATLFEEQLQSEYTELQWVRQEDKFPVMHGIVEAFHDITKEFVRTASPAILNVASNADDRVRRFSYYQALDPEISEIQQALIRQDRQGNKDAVMVLSTEYKRRLDWLERYREKEWEKIVRQQDFRDEVFDKRLARIAEIRNEQAQIALLNRQRQEQWELAQSAQVGDALTAALVPLGQSIGQQPRGRPSAESWATFSQDLSSALAAVPDAPPPPEMFDTTLVDSDLSGLESLGTDPFERIGGKSVIELRQNFLRVYRQNIRNIRRYL